MNGYLRFRWTVTEDHPTLKSYDQDVWATLADAKMPLAPSLNSEHGHTHAKQITDLRARKGW